MRPLTFVVGTGRTGSTALSRILNLHPDVLSLNELFVSLNGPAGLTGEPVDGERFWRILTDPHPVFDAMIRAGTPLPEFLHARRSGGHEAGPTGTPALSLMVLPHLTDDPDGLLDELAPRVTSWPRRPAARHYESFFALLADRFGRRAVVERSGHSLAWVPTLHASFPGARFVHMYRHGPDCALSMSRHPGYRAAGLALDILERTGVDHLSELTDAHVRQLPTGLAEVVANRFDPVRIMDHSPSPAVFGSVWSEMIKQGAVHLAAVPAASRTALGYERLLAAPDEELTRLAEFAGVEPHAEWLEAGRRLLDGSRRGAASRLPARELAALEERCSPGARVLREALAAT
ncbi:sulfotransferase [Streptomyces sp. NPDC017890]|uniref:sulfotransferase n=1 Tax=Streptomyces sp. NPDC017890 TaxID=3365015 RepID=UPI0037B71E84